MQEDNNNRKASGNNSSTIPTGWDVVWKFKRIKSDSKITTIILAHFDVKSKALDYCGETNKSLRMTFDGTDDMKYNQVTVLPCKNQCEHNTCGLILKSMDSLQPKRAKPRKPKRDRKYD